MFTKHPGVVFGLIGATTLIVIGVLLVLQKQLSIGLIAGVALLSLLITGIIAVAVGRQASWFNQNVTVEGAILGFFMTVGAILSNMIVAASSAYETVVNNLTSNKGSLQITSFELSPGSVIGSLLINVLIATAVATIAGRFFSRNQAGNIPAI